MSDHPSTPMRPPASEPTTTPAGPPPGWLSQASSAEPRGTKRARDGTVRELSGLADIARSMTRGSKTALLDGPDELIEQAEDILTSKTPGDASIALTNLWRGQSDPVTKQASIGPASDRNFFKANYVASLLIQLHHPHCGTKAAPIPQALLAWLNTYHNPFPDDFSELSLASPSPSALESFWDAIYANALRGKFDRVIRLLADAGWEHACTAEEDGADDGYNDQQLQNIQEVVRRCARLLQSCPSIVHADWNVAGTEWAIFRQHTRQALEDLQDFAGSSDMSESRSGRNIFQESIAGSSLGMSGISRRAESRVPWTIYQNLTLLYNLVLGSVDDILMASQDWLEASLYSAIWWDGGDEVALTTSLGRMNLRRSSARQVDTTPVAAYQRRLMDAFLQITDNPGDPVFIPDTMDLVQVALGCVLENSVGSAIGVLRTWDLPITAAVVEIAALGDWLPSARWRRRQNLQDQGLSKEDLLVFSHAPVEVKSDDVDRDALFGEYAGQLARKPTFKDKEGWELAVAVLRRLDDGTNAQTKISGVLESLNLEEESRIEKVLGVCDQMGLTEHRNNLAERFADRLAESSQSYGTALIYYARARDLPKIKETLRLLTSACLLHSAAMPSAQVIDAKLESLISKERPGLRELARVDIDAAMLLSPQLSGYATLRAFYDLRDQDIYIQQSNGASSSDEQPLRSLERRRAAATKLVTLINSAADCIPGGLYDPATESVIPVDGLLVLFGEALVFLGVGTRIFTKDQVFDLLKLIEAFSQAPFRVRENADSLLAASLQAYHDNNSAISGIFKKPKSSMSQSSWDMLASSMMDTQSQVKGAKIERAWDWRKGMDSMGGLSVKADTVILTVRQGLVKEVMKAWGGMLKW